MLKLKARALSGARLQVRVRNAGSLGGTHACDLVAAVPLNAASYDKVRYELREARYVYMGGTTNSLTSNAWSAKVELDVSDLRDGRYKLSYFKHDDWTRNYADAYAPSFNV